MDELRRMDSALKADKELGKQLEAAIREEIAAGAKSDGEAMAKAANKLGYCISVQDLDKAAAQAEELSENELQMAYGGNTDSGNKGLTGNDEYGHDSWCMIAWHCFVVSLHTESEEKDVTCFADYRCANVYIL